MPDPETNTTEITPTPTPAPNIAGDNALVKKISELERRVELLEKYATEQGANLSNLKAELDRHPATKSRTRFFKD